MEQLYTLKLRVDEKEKEAELMRNVIKDKEDAIVRKENEKAFTK